MLSIASYTRDYIDTCRSTVDMTVAAYENLGSAVQATAGIDLAPVEFAMASFEPAFYNHMVLALDGYFSNRARNKEGKDGNPLNEVRMLCVALMQNNGRLEADRTIKWRPRRRSSATRSATRSASRPPTSRASRRRSSPSSKASTCGPSPPGGEAEGCGAAADAQLAGGDLDRLRARQQRQEGVLDAHRRVRPAIIVEPTTPNTISSPGTS